MTYFSLKLESEHEGDGYGMSTQDYKLPLETFELSPAVGRWAAYFEEQKRKSEEAVLQTLAPEFEEEDVTESD